MLTEFESFVFENFVFSKRKRKKMLTIAINWHPEVCLVIRITDSDFYSFHSIGLAKRQRTNNVWILVSPLKISICNFPPTKPRTLILMAFLHNFLNVVLSRCVYNEKKRKDKNKMRKLNLKTKNLHSNWTPIFFNRYKFVHTTTKNKWLIFFQWKYIQ